MDADLRDHVLVDRRALDHRDAVGERVFLDRRAVVGPDLDVDSEHLTIAPEQGEHRCGEHERATVRNAGLDHEVRPDTPDDLLERYEILRVLDDRTSEPGEVVRVPIAVDAIEEIA